MKEKIKGMVKPQSNYYNNFSSQTKSFDFTTIAALNANKPFKPQKIKIQHNPIQQNAASTIKVEINSPSQSETEHVEAQNSSSNSEKKNSFYQQLVSKLLWQCPACGQTMYGPIHFFVHVKLQHKHDSIEKVMQWKAMRTLNQKFPQVPPSQIKFVEQLDYVPIPEEIENIAKKNYAFYLKNKISPPSSKRQKGSYADMAQNFIQCFNDNKFGQIQMLQLFIRFLQEYVYCFIGTCTWKSQSPKDMLKYSNHMIKYYLLSEASERYLPLNIEDIKTLIHILAKWMYMNHWTNDRIFKNPPARKYDDYQQLMQEEKNQSKIEQQSYEIQMGQTTKFQQYK